MLPPTHFTLIPSCSFKSVLAKLVADSSFELYVKTRSYPSEARTVAMPFPIPRVPPVMMAIGLELDGDGGGGEDEDDVAFDDTIIAKKAQRRRIVDVAVVLLP